MMGFNFDLFFGYEEQINTMQDRMLLILFAIVMYTQVFLLVLTGYLREFKISLFRSQLNILILTFGLTIFFGTLVSVLLFYLVYAITRVKILYCWIAILISMFYFSVFNYKSIKQVLSSLR